MNLDDYLKSVPRGGAAELATRIGVPASLISQWRTGLRPVPATRCLDIEIATEGKIRCEQLRPDVNWAAIRSSDPKAA